MLDTYRCTNCDKKLFEGNLPLLLQKKHTDPGQEPRLEHLCPRCKHLNVFTLESAPITIAK